jgi:WD40 repeat protein
VRRPDAIRLFGTVCVLVAVVLAAAAMAPALAGAARVHTGIASLYFGQQGTGVGDLELSAYSPEQSGSGLAVNDGTHDVYVADTGNLRIDEFSVAGSFIRAWGWGVATGASELQVCSATCQRGLSGSAPGEFVNPVYVAVDNDPSSPSLGDVYVGDMGDNLVTKFDAEGHLITTWGNNGENAKGEKTEPNGQLNGAPSELFDSVNGGLPEQPLAGIAVDTIGRLSVFDHTAKTFAFDQAGTLLFRCKMPDIAGPAFGGIAAATGSTPRLVAIDGAERTVQFELTNEANCKAGGFVTTGRPRPPTGLATDTFTGELYVDKAGLLIEDIPSSCVPNPSGCSASQVFGEESALNGAAGVAVDSGRGTVYVAESARNQILAFDLALETTVGAATEVTAHTAVLHGSVNPVGSELSRCQFEYGPNGTFEFSAPCMESVGSIGSGSSPVSVQADVSGLDGTKTYSFRLRAANAHGNAYSEPETLITSTTATITQVKASNLTGSSADLEAVVRPEGLVGEYHFDYGVCEDLGDCAASPYTATVPMPDATLATLPAETTVSQHVEGLLAGATYHFRVVVNDANGVAAPSPEGTFVYEPVPPSCGSPRPVDGARLADCRAYEMVTPPNKDGALIDNGGFLTEPSISPDGSRVLMKSIQCFHRPESCIGVRETEGSPFSFQRDASGWSTEPLAPSASAGSTMLTYDAEADQVLYTIAAEAPALEQFVARRPDGSLVQIGPVSEKAGVALANIASNVRVATADLSHVVYQGTSPWPSLEGGATGNAVLEYTGTGNSTPQLVGVTGGANSTSLISACGTFIGAGGSNSTASSYGSLADDGRTVYFTVSKCSTGTGSNVGVSVPALQLYARVQGAHEMSTVHVSAPGPSSVCDSACEKQPTADANFQGASADGSRIFFTSTQQLTNDASADRRVDDTSFGSGCESTPSSDTGCNLYEFVCPNHCENEAERKLVAISAGDSSGIGPQVQGVLAIPSNGSDVYFIARGVLTETANDFGEKAGPGLANLYVYRSSEGSPAKPEFITALSSADALSMLHIGGGGIGVANVTPDGRYLVFVSGRGLTPDARQGDGPAQVYRYDAQSGQLTRVSIGQRGFNDNGNAAVADARIVMAEQAFFTGQGPGRSDPTMSDDGRFVFFQSPTGLTPGALNDKRVTGNANVLAQNVYEWQAPGTQSSLQASPCSEPSGCVSLVSDGRDVTEGSNAHANQSAVELLGADTTGANVFFWTADQLVPSDTDTQVDLYDARVDGGFPAPPAPPVCEAGETFSGEACRGAGSVPGLFGAPGSVAFSGAGNAVSENPVGKPTPRGLTRAQKLKRALGLCRKRYRMRGAHRKRSVCERRARERYRPAAKKSGGRARHGIRVRG